MVQLSCIFSGITKSIGWKNRHDVGREAADALAKEAKKNEMVLTSSGCVAAAASNNLASAFSKGGKKGINQDRFIVWEDFGFQDDMILCGVFDGHGHWGHLVAKRVRELLPPALLHNWQKRVARAMDGDGVDLWKQSCAMDGDGVDLWKQSCAMDGDGVDLWKQSCAMDGDGVDLWKQSCAMDGDGVDPWKQSCAMDGDGVDLWKQSYFEACSTIDQDLEQHAHSFYSGTTALTLLRQGDLLIVANVGDSRAVLATADDDGRLVPVQLTVDLKPNLPRESERIAQSRGMVLSCHDEPGVYRVWMPNGGKIEGPGLAISRAFGDYFIKDFGLISEPELTSRNITCRDQFAILATDGVWDVVSNEEAVEIVSSTGEREEAAKRLVESAICAWKRKRRGIPMDDISAICLFFHSNTNTKIV